MALKRSLLAAAAAALPVASHAITPNYSLNTYWGQSGVGDRLAQYCESSSIDYVTLAFVNTSPENDKGTNYPGTNFAAHCASDVYSVDGTKSKLLSECTYIRSDIETCHSLGKKIILSIGGVYSSTSNYSLSSVENGIEFANFLFDAFGPYTGLPGPRPFDLSPTEHVSVDGFDFDIETKFDDQAPYIAMVNQLRFRMALIAPGMILTAAPQCPQADEYFQMKDILTYARFDKIWIQFYNNQVCDAINGGFNYNDWARFIRGTVNAGAELFIGLPGSSAAAGSGYITPKAAQDLICSYKKSASFGGAMLWDANYAANNVNNGVNYYDAVAEALQCGGCPGDVCLPTTTTSSVSSTTSHVSTSATSSASSTSSSTYPTSSHVSSSGSSSTSAGSSTPSTSAPASSSTSSDSRVSSSTISSTSASSFSVSSYSVSSTSISSFSVSSYSVSSTSISSFSVSSYSVSSSSVPSSSVPSSSVPSSSIPSSSIPSSSIPSSSASSSTSYPTSSSYIASPSGSASAAPSSYPAGISNYPTPSTMYSATKTPSVSSSASSSETCTDEVSSTSYAVSTSTSVASYSARESSSETTCTEEASSTSYAVSVTTPVISYSASESSSEHISMTMSDQSTVTTSVPSTRYPVGSYPTTSSGPVPSGGSYPISGTSSQTSATVYPTSSPSSATGGVTYPAGSPTYPAGDSGSSYPVSGSSSQTSKTVYPTSASSSATGVVTYPAGSPTYPGWGSGSSSSSNSYVVSPTTSSVPVRIPVTYSVYPTQGSNTTTLSSSYPTTTKGSGAPTYPATPLPTGGAGRGIVLSVGSVAFAFLFAL